MAIVVVCYFGRKCFVLKITYIREKKAWLFSRKYLVYTPRLESVALLIIYIPFSLLFYHINNYSLAIILLLILL